RGTDGTAELSTSVADAVTGSLKSPADAPVYVRVVDAVTAGGAMRPIWLVRRSVNHKAWSGPAVIAPAPAPGVGMSNSSSTDPADLAGRLLCEPEVAVGPAGDRGRPGAGGQRGDIRHDARRAHLSDPVA